MDLRVYLIVDRAGETRTVKRMPTDPIPGEYAFEINLTIPDTPAILGKVDIELPEPPPCPDPKVHLIVENAKRK